MARTIAAIAAFALLAGSLCAFDDAPPVGSEEITKLVEQLGDEDFDTRESAEKRLATLGDAALPALREACNSGNPEVSRRAGRLASRISYRGDNKKNLAPTLVTLDAELVPVRDVLAELISQTKYLISLDMDTAGDRSSKKITVKVTKVPFWEAVLAVCDAADLRIHSVAGYVATDLRGPNVSANEIMPVPQPPPLLPGQPVQPRFGSGARPASSPTTSNAIVLAPRNGAARRPVAVYGAVCVEAIKMPDGTGVPESAAALLNVWPEPKLNWVETTAIKLDRAEDDVGQLLASLPNATIGVAPQVLQQGNVNFVRQVNGGVVIVNNKANVPLPAAGLSSFVPSIRQTVVQLKPGKRPTTLLTDLRGSLFGMVRVGPEALIALQVPEGGKSLEGSSPAGAQLKMQFSQDKTGKWTVIADLFYDRAQVQPANEPFSIQGVRITDAAGKAFGLSMRSGQGSGRGDSTWVRQISTFQLYDANGATGDPSAIEFRATYPKPVEVPFSLHGVPVVGGKK